MPGAPRASPAARSLDRPHRRVREAGAARDLGEAAGGAPLEKVMDGASRGPRESATSPEPPPARQRGRGEPEGETVERESAQPEPGAPLLHVGASELVGGVAVRGAIRSASASRGSAAIHRRAAARRDEAQDETIRARAGTELHSHAPRRESIPTVHAPFVAIQA